MFRLEKLRILLVCLLQATEKGSYGQMKPSNAVAEVGGQAIFNCSGQFAAPLWFMSNDGTATNLLSITVNCQVSINLQNHYKTEQLGDTANCNLIVYAVTMEQAGVYWCAESVTSYALLTVIDSLPVITLNASDVVMENENVIITCNLHHNGSVAPAPTLRPYFYWTNSNGQNVSSSYDSTAENTAVSQITVTAGRQDITPYTCHVYLQLIPPTNPNYAINTPNLNNSVTSPPTNVLYPSSNAKIVATSAGLIACEAKDLTCHSDANPPPIYIWVDLTSGNVTNEEKIIAECGVNYTCYASNSIRNVTYVNSSTFYEDPIKNITCKFPRATNMDISGQFCKEDYCECECNSAIIHCSVDAYPEPLYEWLIPNGSRVQGQTVEATMNGVFVCRSYTLIDGLYLMEAYKSINISGCYYSPNTTTENVLQSNCSSTEIAAIVLGVLLAISIAINIFSFVLFYRKGAVKKRDSNEPEMTQPSSHSQEPHYQDPSHETWAKPEYEELHH